MARSDVESYCLLNRWPVIMQESPWHFNQLAGLNSPLTAPCDQVYVQEERDDIANALNLAVELVAQHLGFFPRPVWYSERLSLGHGFPLGFQEHQLTYGYIEEFGIRTVTLIDDAVVIVYSDPDGDGIDELATMTVATTVDTDEIRVYFRTADGAPEAGHTDWEIEPLTLTSAAGVVTITGPSYLFVSPDVVWANPYEDPNYVNKLPFNPADATNFVTHVDVYRVYSNTTGAVTLLTDPIWDSSVSPTGDIAENAVGRIVNPRLSLIQVRLPSCTDLANCTYAPTQVWVSYKSGYPLRNRRMDRRLEQNIIRIANTKMSHKTDTFCGERTNTMWQTDRAPLDRASPTASWPPWGGMTFGEFDAWNMLKSMQLGVGGKVTMR